MQFVYHPNAGMKSLKIEDEQYQYLFKVRRTKKEDKIYLRNLNDMNLYTYAISSIDKKRAILELEEFDKQINEPIKKLHIGWCIVEPKLIEKNIAALNEIGVTKVTFINCQYSQRSHHLNFEKLNKILIQSSMQCGRSSIIQISTSNCLEDFLKDNNDAYMLHFGENYLQDYKDVITTILIGCEGGFSIDEINLLDKKKLVSFNTKLIQRSETAALSCSSILLS